MRRIGIQHGHVVTFVVVSALATLLTMARAVPKLPDGDSRFTAQLSAATGLVLRENAPVWIADTKTTDLRSALFWHEILFLGAKTPGGPSDLFRAEVRVEKEHGIFSLRSLKNLTNSPAGDEYKLIVSPPFAAVATRALGQVRSVTVFDFRGQVLPESGEWSMVTRFLSRLTDLLKTGHAGGIAKTTVRFTRPPEQASLSFVEEQNSAAQIEVSWTDRRGSPRQARVAVDGNHSSDEQLIPTSEVRLPKRPILWLVDTVRSIPWIGPGPIEWAEGRFFAMRDGVRRFLYSISGDETSSDDEASDIAEAAPELLELPSGLEVGAVAPKLPWPPPKIEPPVFKRVARGEGTWRPAAPDFMRTLPGAPTAVYRTFTRPDRERPYVRVQLFAMDMRQLQLHMVGGYEDPQPTTGSQGTGRIPRRPDLLSRLVIAFNGAFKTEHGAYGMMVERDVLLPPLDGAATVASLSDGRTLMGSWPAGLEIPESMSSLRQNMDPLIEDGVVNPRRRYLWGFTLSEDIKEMHTIRSGICMTDSGTLIYGWGEDLTAKTLGVAMNAAGCVYGLHLDMNPFHTSYIYYRFADDVEEGKRPEFKAELGLKEMRFSPNRYVNGAPKDFFFLTLKDPSPGKEWSAEGIAQPAPAYVPAVFKRRVGRSNLIAIDLTRATAQLVHGEIPAELASTSARNSSTKNPDVLAEIDLGRWSSSRGQLVNGAVVAAMTPERASLGFDETGAFALGMWPLNIEGTLIDNAIQGSWLIPGTPSGQEINAVGISDDKWLVLGHGPGDELARAFEEPKVSRAVAFPATRAEAPIILRGERGMLDLDNDPVTSRTNQNAVLRISARPRPLGMDRLEEIFESRPKTNNKKKKRNP